VDDVLIWNQETGLALPSAPEFGADGTWPPIATEWLPLRWELFETETHSVSSFIAYIFFVLNRPHDAQLDENSLSPDLIYEPNFPDYRVVAKFARKYMDVDIRFKDNSLQFHKKKSLVASEFPGRAEDAFSLLPFDSKELRRLVHYVRWRRRDPVTQLPPGSSRELMHSLTTGLSVEHSQDLAGSLGLSLGSKAPSIQAQLSRQLKQTFGFKLDITAREEISTKLMLANQSTDRDRLFALWHIDHMVTVDALSTFIEFGRGGRLGTALTRRSRGHSEFRYSGKPTWTRLGGVEFMISNEPFITSLAKEPRRADALPD
jgi:hypothetical protein